MKSVELRRHAEKDPRGSLSKKGIDAAKKLGEALPKFSKVVSSGSERARLTAKLITDVEPQVDLRASMWMASPEKSAAINNIATEQGIMFLEAMRHHNDPEILRSTDQRAEELNTLIEQLLADMHGNERGLIISHDISISIAMTKRGIPLTALSYLEGFVIYEDGSIQPLLVQ